MQQLFAFAHYGLLSYAICEGLGASASLIPTYKLGVAAEVKVAGSPLHASLMIILVLFHIEDPCLHCTMSQQDLCDRLHTTNLLRKSGK